MDPQDGPNPGPAPDPVGGGQPQANPQPGAAQNADAPSADPARGAGTQAAPAPAKPTTGDRSIQSSAPAGMNGKTQAAFVFSAVVVGLALAAVVFGRFFPSFTTIDPKKLVEELRADAKAGQTQDVSVPAGDAVVNSQNLKTEIQTMATQAVKESHARGLSDASGLPHLGERELKAIMREAMEKALDSLPKPSKKGG